MKNTISILCLLLSTVFSVQAKANHCPGDTIEISNCVYHHGYPAQTLCDYTPTSHLFSKKLIIGGDAGGYNGSGKFLRATHIEKGENAGVHCLYKANGVNALATIYAPNLVSHKTSHNYWKRMYNEDIFRCMADVSQCPVKLAN